jgi:branched-chain amino acid transport system permease protein
MGEYGIHLAIMVGMYLILAQSFNLVFGLGGLFNLAHVASYAIGAYTSALLSTKASWGFEECLLASVCVSALFASLIGAISVRLTQDYFAIGTLAFSAVVTALIVNWKSLTNGVLGVSGIPRPIVLGADTIDNLTFLYVTVALALLSQAVLYVAFRNRFSRLLRAQAENEEAALAIGCDTSKVRFVSFYVASALTGMAGSLFAFYINYIDPSSFSLTEMVFIMTIAVVGRPGSFWGVTAATFFLVLLPEPLRFIDFPPGVLGPMRQMLHAFILFAVVAWNRENIFPVERSV